MPRQEPPVPGNKFRPYVRAGRNEHVSLSTDPETSHEAFCNTISIEQAPGRLRAHRNPATSSAIARARLATRTSIALTLRCYSSPTKRTRSSPLPSSSATQRPIQIPPVSRISGYSPAAAISSAASPDGRRSPGTLSSGCNCKAPPLSAGGTRNSRAPTDFPGSASRAERDDCANTGSEGRGRRAESISANAGPAGGGRQAESVF